MSTDVTPLDESKARGSFPASKVSNMDSPLSSHMATHMDATIDIAPLHEDHVDQCLEHVGVDTSLGERFGEAPFCARPADFGRRRREIAAG